MTASSNKPRSPVLVALAMLIVLSSTPAHTQAPRKVKMTLPVVALTTAPVYLAEAKAISPRKASAWN